MPRRIRRSKAPRYIPHGPVWTKRLERSLAQQRNEDGQKPNPLPKSKNTS